MIRKIIHAYPSDTPRDFILETVVQNLYEGNTDEPEIFENNEPRSPSNGALEITNTMLSLLEEYEHLNQQSSNNQITYNRYFCTFCRKGIGSNQEELRIFACKHYFCHECLLHAFIDRIKNKENVNF